MHPGSRGDACDGCSMLMDYSLLVLWTPWPQALDYTSRSNLGERYCANWVGYRSHSHM